MATYDYDLIVIGGGAAGLGAAGIGANLGAKTLLIEQHKLGGDCTWTGCVPSKTLLKAAKVAHQTRHAGRYGLTDQAVTIDFARVMAHVRRVRETIYDHADAPPIYEAMGIDVRHGRARFVDPHTVEIDGDGTGRVSGRTFIIAAGAAPFVPPIPGLREARALTSDTLFELMERPDRLAILGAGPIGTEMAQAFQRLGVQVTVIDQADRILGKDDPELAAMLKEVLDKEGVTWVLGAEVQEVRRQDTRVTITTAINGTVRTIEADALLVTTGRRANLDGLNLEAAGIAYTKAGITVNARCRTNQRHIYAAGDVTGRYQLTHMSEHMAKIAATNAILKIPMSIDAKHVPWATYTDPELAHVGATEQELQERGMRYAVYRFPYTKVDRAVTEGETTGLIKVYAKAWNGTILGASVLGTSAGELISEYAVAMKHGVTLRQLADTIHPYPSYGLAARRAADQWYARKQSPTLIRLLQRVFGYRGPVIEPDPDRVV